MNNDRFAYIAKVLEALDNYFNEGGVYVAALSDGAQLLDDDTTIAEAVSKAYGLLSSPNSPIKNTPQSSGEVRDSGDTKVITVKPFEVDAVKRMNLGNEARRAARKSGLKAGAVRVIGDKRKKPARHKKPLRGDE